MTTFTDDVAEQLDGYNPYPVFAFLTLVITLICCVVAIFNSRLIILPLLSAIAGLFALFRLFASDMKRGYRMAGFAFLASTFVFTGLVSYQALRYRNIEALANQYCDEWLDLS